MSCDRGSAKGKTCCNSGGAGGTLNLVGYCKSVLAPEKPVDKEFIKDRLLFEGVEKF